MDRTDTRWGFREGDEVYGADGSKVGKVIAVQPNYVVVEKGFFFPTDYYVPTGAVANYEDGKIYLTVTKEAALAQGWDAEPAVADASATTAGTADAGYGTGVAAETARVEDTATLRVPVHEEELTATKRAREIGQVRIEKDVVAEERTLAVPVTEERVHVSRHAVDRPMAAGDATAFEEGVIEVPIRGEDVELRKDVRVTGEVEIGKEAVQRTEQVSGTVRREEVRVTEDVVADATTTGAAGTNRNNKR